MTTTTTRRALREAGPIYAAAATIVAIQSIPGWSRVPAPIAYWVALLAGARVATWTRAA